MDAIHLILDNCRPDDRNPCILAFESPRVSPEPRERGPGRAGRALLPAPACSWLAYPLLTWLRACLSLCKPQRGELKFAR